MLRATMEPAAPAPGSPEHRADATPDAPCLSDDLGGRRSRREWDRRADAVAARLDAHGVAPGDRVAFAPPAGVALLDATLALAKLGASAVLLPPGVAPERAGAAAVPPALLDPGPAVATPGGAAPDPRPGEGAPRRLTGTFPTPESVLFTAGRTGPPKAVVRRLDPARTAAVARTLADLVGRLGLGPGHAHLLAGPPARSSPLFWAQLVLALGGRVHVAQRSGPERLLAAVDAEAIQSTFLGPDDLVALAALPVDEQERHDTSSLDLVLTGDGPLSPAAFTAAEDLLGLDVARDVYATAETGPVAVDGIPLAGVDVEQRGGTLWVRSPLLADGYHDHPDATAAAFRDGWFDTGDPGRLDPDGSVAVRPT